MTNKIPYPKIVEHDNLPYTVIAFDPNDMASLDAIIIEYLNMQQDLLAEKGLYKDHIKYIKSGIDAAKRILKNRLIPTEELLDSEYDDGDRWMNPWAHEYEDEDEDEDMDED